MIREFEGKTEQEAIDMAISELGLERDDFDNQEDLEKHIKNYIDFNKELMKQTKKELIIEDIVETYLDHKDQEMLIKILKQRHNLWD